MGINLVAMTDNFEKQIEIGILGEDFFRVLSSYKSSKIKLLKNIDIYDNTFFNRYQLEQVKKEIAVLEECINCQKDLEIMNKAINFVGEKPIYDYLVLAGD